jgi:hypothetical protein
MAWNIAMPSFFVLGSYKSPGDPIYNPFFRLFRLAQTIAPLYFTAFFELAYEFDP